MDVDSDTASVPAQTTTEQLVHEQERETSREDFLRKVQHSYDHDPWFSPESIKQEQLTKHAELWWKSTKLVIPAEKQLREEVLRLCHDAPWAGHLGRDKNERTR